MKMNKRNPVGDGRAEAPDYGKMIIELIEEMDESDYKFLMQVYTIVHRHIKKRGH